MIGSTWLHIGVAGLAFFTVTIIWLLLRVLRPLRALSNSTKQIASGDFVALQMPLSSVQEVGSLHHTMSSLAQHIQRSREEEIMIRHALTDGQEMERQRIAHELHDDTVQALVAVAQSIDLAIQWIESNPQGALPLLNAAREQAVESVDGLRRMITNLRPPVLEELGLVPALRMLGQGDPSVSILIEVSGAERRMDDSLELALFRVAQEAVNNASRHGKATQIALGVRFDPVKISMSISDNGAGFTPPTQLDALARDAHYGLLGIQERVSSLNGTLSIVSDSGRGTEIRVVVPLQRTVQPETSVRDPV